MDRQQAMTLLRELAVNDLVEPSYVNVCERSPGNYQLQIKTEYNRAQLDEFAKKHGLTIEKGKAQEYLVIYKP